jgi:hypothetical protein
VKTFNGTLQANVALQSLPCGPGLRYRRLGPAAQRDPMRPASGPRRSGVSHFSGRDLRLKQSAKAVASDERAPVDPDQLKAAFFRQLIQFGPSDPRHPACIWHLVSKCIGEWFRTRTLCSRCGHARLTPARVERAPEVMIRTHAWQDGFYEPSEWA